MTSGETTRRAYKTVAMPQLLRAGRKRGRTAGESIAEALSTVINAQAAKGWTYLRAETVRALESRGLFRKAEEVVYTVLVFERTVEAADTAAEPAASLGEERGRATAPRRAFDAEVDRAGALLRETRARDRAAPNGAASQDAWGSDFAEDDAFDRGFEPRRAPPAMPLDRLDGGRPADDEGLDGFDGEADLRPASARDGRLFRARR